MWVEKHGATWRIRDLVAGKKVTIKGGYTTKTAAKNGLIAFKGDQMRGEFIDPRAGDMTLAALADEWWKGHNPSLKPSSVVSEGRRLRLHIKPLLGEFSVGELDTLAINEWVRELGDPTIEGRKPLAPKSVLNCHGVLYVLMEYAVNRKLIRANPCSSTSLPRAGDHEMRFLTAAEIGQLLAFMPQVWRPLVLTLVSTGCRIGEAAALRVHRTDVLGGQLRIERTLHEIGGHIVETTPKTKRSRRTVSIPKSVAEALVPLVANKGREEYVFLSHRGHTFRYASFLRMWIRVLKGTPFEGLRIHDLRHTHASQLIAKGRPLTAIQRRLGHSSIQVTSDRYGHLLPEVDEGMLTAVEESLSLIDMGGVLGETIPEQRGVTRNNGDTPEVENEKTPGQPASQPIDQGSPWWGRGELNPPVDPFR